MQKKNYLRRTLALITAFLILATMMPVQAFAEPGTSGTNERSSGSGLNERQLE